MLIDPKKTLYYWASVRNLKKDIIYTTRIEEPVRAIEANMPDSIIYAAYSAYKFRFKDVPADYSEVYVYSNQPLQERFPKNNKPGNLIILKNKGLEAYGKTTTIANTFVDLWNIDMWYAKSFLNALEARINGLLE